MSLTIHQDDSLTLSKRRNLVCFEAAWELDALAELLPMVAAKDTPETTKTGYQVRCIASRIKMLALILTTGMGDEMESVDNLERQLKVTD